MARHGATLGLLLLLSTAVACDTAGEHEGCADGTDPSACARSTFPAQDTKARDVADCAWLAAGELSETARAYALEQRIRLIEGIGLAVAVPAAS